MSAVEQPIPDIVNLAVQTEPFEFPGAAKLAALRKSHAELQQELADKVATFERQMATLQGKMAEDRKRFTDTLMAEETRAKQSEVKAAKEIHDLQRKLTKTSADMEQLAEKRAALQRECVNFKDDGRFSKDAMRCLFGGMACRRSPLALCARLPLTIPTIHTRAYTQT
jgi:hypothetical protein